MRALSSPAYGPTGFGPRQTPPQTPMRSHGLTFSLAVVLPLAAGLLGAIFSGQPGWLILALVPALVWYRIEQFASHGARSLLAARLGHAANEIGRFKMSRALPRHGKAGRRHRAQGV